MSAFLTFACPALGTVPRNTEDKNERMKGKADDPTVGQTRLTISFSPHAHTCRAVRLGGGGAGGRQEERRREREVLSGSQSWMAAPE